MKLKVPVLGIMMLFPFNSINAATIYTNEATFISAIGTVNTLIDFDTDSSGNAIGNNTHIDQQYLSNGVDFNSFNGGVPLTTNVFTFSGNNLKTVPDTRGGGGFEAVFTNNVTGIGLQVGGLHNPSFGNTFFEIFDENNTSLGAYNLFDVIGDGPLEYLFFGITSNVSISRLEISIGASDYVVFDNIQISAVPVPAAVWLMGSGLLGLIGYSRKRISSCCVNSLKPAVH